MADGVKFISKIYAHHIVASSSTRSLRRHDHWYVKPCWCLLMHCSIFWVSVLIIGQTITALQSPGTTAVARELLNRSFKGPSRKMESYVSFWGCDWSMPWLFMDIHQTSSHFHGLAMIAHWKWGLTTRQVNDTRKRFHGKCLYYNVNAAMHQPLPLRQRTIKM